MEFSGILWIKFVSIQFVRAQNNCFRQRYLYLFIYYKIFNFYYFFRIEHQMNGKNGTIEIQLGTPERIHKDKSGHLLIVSSSFGLYFII